ncbi:MAG: ABC transporter permease [Calditrichaeota bacterium]|nr:MAG: ABC transporter permease [Calditrichota bacterium]
MNKLFAIIKREYLQRVKTKGFLIGTLLMPIFILGISFLPALMMRSNLGESIRLVVIDETGQLFEPLEAAFSEIKNGKGDAKYQLSQLKSGESLEQGIVSLGQKVNAGELDGILVLPRAILENNQFQYHTKNIGNFEIIQTVERTVSGVVRSLRLNESGLDVELVKKLNNWVSVKTFKIGESGSQEQRAEISFLFSMIMGLLLYMMLILYGQFVMRAVIEDKNSRVVEVILSSVKPFQYMAGKVIGIGATGLTQFLIWVATAVLISMYGLVFVKSFAPEVSQLVLPQVSPWIYVAFLAFFLLGYLFYATLSASIGSMVNSESEAQSYQWVVMMPIILAFFFMFAVNNSPNSLLAVILSLIPFFAPILMFSRILAEAAPLWQILISFVIMILSIWGSLWVCGRIFRVGILMYGKKPNLPEIVKWIKYS